MGIFSDKCVDPNCPGRVPKAAKFCRLCGKPAADADTTCGRCGVTVSTSSEFCWKCGCNLADQSKAPLFGNRWVRDADDFATRVDECDVKGFLSKGLIIEHGTQAMLFQRGKFCGYLDPGTYDAGGFAKKFATLNLTSPTSVVLTDAGDVELRLEAIKLYSKEQMEIDATFKAVVRLKDTEQFFTNAFKSRNRLSVGYLGGSLTEELRGALQTFVGARPVDELYSNASLRTDVEGQMQLELEPILERIGLEMVQLRFIDFFCPAYDPMREKEAELYVDTRQADIDIDRLKLTQRLRKSMTADKMDGFKNEKDFEDFVRQTEHELGLKDVIRSDEMDKLKRQFAFERNRELLTQQIEIEGIKSEHQRSEARLALIAKIESVNLEHEAKLKRDLDEAKNDVEVGRAQLELKRLESEQDFWEAEKAIELRRKSQLLELEVKEKEQQLEAKTLQERSKASAQALLSILDGPAADRIAALEELQLKEKLSPDQIVAMTAAESPAVAQALAEKYKAEAAMGEDRFRQLQEFMAQQQHGATEAADRLERVMNAALQQMGSTATTRAQAPQPASQTVVAGGAGGNPVVINPQTPKTEKPCPKCNKMIPSDSGFCPLCGKKI